MIKLSLVKKFGIELVSGDVAGGECVTPLGATDLNRCDVYNKWDIKEFTPRLISDGIPASIDGDVLLEITNGNGLVLYISARNVAWHAWRTWRPSMEWLMQQASDKPVTYKDDTQHFGEDFLVSAMTLPDNHQIPMAPQAPKARSEQLNESIKEAAQKVSFVDNETANATVKAHIESMRPVFTQAMAQAGELPPVGAECNICCDSSEVFFKGSVIAYFEDLIWLNMGDRNPVRMTCEVRFKPLDTRTEKEKSVDAALDLDEYRDGLGMMSRKDFVAKLYDAGLLK